MDYYSLRLFKYNLFLKKFTLFCLILVNYLFRPAAKAATTFASVAEYNG